MSGKADQLIAITAATFGGVDIALGLTSFNYNITVETGVNKGDDDIFGTEEAVIDGTCEWGFEGINQELASLVAAGSKGVLVVSGRRVSDGGTGTMTLSKATAKTENPTLGSRELGAYSSSGSAMSADGITSPVVWSTAP